MSSRITLARKQVMLYRTITTPPGGKRRIRHYRTLCQECDALFEFDTESPEVQIVRAGPGDYTLSVNCPSCNATSRWKLAPPPLKEVLPTTEAADGLDEVDARMAAAGPTWPPRPINGGSQ